jgi:hypothetical protein
MKNTDLFETPELLPDNIKAILDSFDCETLSYQDCEAMLAEMEKLGYTFEFGLDAVPFNLQISENLKYFVYKLSHDKGQICQKTAARSIQAAIENIMAFENCPKIAIEIKEIPKSLWNLKAKTLFNLKTL